MTNRVLLLGAGFSRNWGGPLSSEIFPRLLGYPKLDAELRSFMLAHENKGFEGVLGLLQEEQRHSQERNPKLANFEAALINVFRDVNEAYKKIPFNWSNDVERTITRFLTRFDAIFTLNQDTLLETHYLNSNVCLSCPERRWDGWIVPGMIGPRVDEFWEPDPQGPKLSNRLQPFIKLHGSSNWRKSAGGPLLVMGDNKKSVISNEPIFLWGNNTFMDFLSRPDTRLLVIGYSFRDSHVNELICEATKGGNLTLFTIDPAGMNVVDDRREENKRAAIAIPSKLAGTLKPWLRGASERPLSTTFGDDIVEHQYVMQYLC